MHHGGIVPIFDYGLIDGSEFMAMEYVEGLDALRAVSAPAPASSPMPEGSRCTSPPRSRTRSRTSTTCATRTTGRSAIVHRDVSPPNILLSWNGDVKLSDFGIALSRRATRATAQRALGGVQGKLHYMAPEQARGEPVGAAADVYALGATLDALLGGGALSALSSGRERERPRGGGAGARALAARVRADPFVPRARSQVSARPPPTSRRAPACSRRSCWAPTAAAPCARGWNRSCAHVSHSDALDDLMGLCLVPVAGDGARTFTISRVWETPLRPRAASAAPPRARGNRCSRRWR